MKHFPGRHTGERIALKLDKMIEELGLDDLKIRKCSAVQLGINDAFKATNGRKAVLDNSKGKAKLTHQSTVALEELKKECKAQNVKFRKPKNPNETRWNSSFPCMESIFHLRKPLTELMSRDPQWSKFTLNFGSGSFWEEL